MGPAKPRNYVLVFEPDLKSFEFRGSANIQFTSSKMLDEIVLNSAELKIEDIHIAWKKQSIPCKWKLDEKNEKLIIWPKQKVSGEAEIHVKFTGTLNDRLVGFYRALYTDMKGRKRVMATTQFEAADARRAFPCWDEPEAKATFDVSILVEPGLDAISNMPVVEKRKIGKRTLFKFARTPIMSTYLLYLGVGEFDYLSSRLGKTQIRVVTTRGKKEHGKIAMEMTKKFLDYYNKYFGIPYPLPKLDMIAVPDFASGAMENWGAITFRETALLFDPKSSSTSTLQRIAEVIAHELAHQWFGNLVTMRWWNDLWLNESFATFMATKAVDSVYPEWDYWDQFMEGSVNEAFSLDALKTSHPIEVEIKKPSEIREIFDDISYDKGGSILRMLEDFIGNDAFRSGIRSYLAKHSYANATTNDLWDALASASNKPVRKMMDTWVRQVGYPIVDARVEGNKIVLTQRRFLLEPDELHTKGQWIIPLTLMTREGKISRLMTGSLENIYIDSGEEWFKLNVGQKGFYRSRYPLSNMEMLKSLVQNRTLPNSDRWGLHSDAFAICLSRGLSLREYLDFVSAYFGESDYLVSMEVASSLYSLWYTCHGESFGEEVRQTARRYFHSLFDRLGWEPKKGEKPNDAVLRGFVINALGKLGDEEVIDGARERFALFLRKPDSISPDIRSSVISLAAWSGSVTQEKLKDLYRKAKTQEEKIRFLAALSDFRDEKALLDSLDFALTDEVRLQDLYVPIAKVAGNVYGHNILWPWFKKNWKLISAKFGGTGNPLFNRIIQSAAMGRDMERAVEVADFFKKNPTPGTEMTVSQTVERIRIRAKFLEKARQEPGCM
jgi:tricorn protease interacting factor F2/3